MSSLSDFSYRKLIDLGSLIGKYKIGVLYGSNEGNYLSSVLQAEREINQLSASHGILANIPELSLELRNVSFETREGAIRRLGEEEGLSVQRSLELLEEVKQKFLRP